MAATVAAYQDTGASGATHTSVDSSGGTAPKFGTDDAVQSTLPVAAPNSTGTNYSANKLFYFNVTSTATTTINNRQIKLAGSPSDAGLKFFFKDIATYAQGTALTASGSNGPATPAGYTALTTSYQQWDNTGVSAGSTGRNGDYVAVVVGIDATYTSGAGPFTNPNISLQWDEA